MIQLDVDVAGLARSRFVVSPLHEVAATLLPWGLLSAPEADPWGARARRVLRGERLPLLSALALDRSGGYVPDFLSPHPLGPYPTVDEQLEQVRATDPGRVVAEFEVLRTGRPQSGLPGQELSEVVRDALGRGGRHVAERLAGELSRYWDRAFAPYWGQARAVLDEDVDRRGRTLARYGAAEMFNSLDPGIGWSDGKLRVDSRFEVARSVPMVLVMPSLTALSPGVSVDPVSGAQRPPAIVYPAGRGRPAAGPATEEIRKLLGPTRAALLAALGRPASTGRLAASHFLSPATVSYHLAVLHRTGLVTRSRSGRSVLYRRTPQGTRLMSPHPRG